jgi:hypothetical protein
VVDVNIDDFMARYPRLYHLAHGEAWPGLQKHGLLSASQLVNLFDAADSDDLLIQRRVDSVRLEHPEHGTAVLRDQRPLNEAKLSSALTDGMTVQEWLRLLGDLAFSFQSGEARRATQGLRP